MIENIGERLKKILEGKFYMLEEIFIICFYGIENLKIGTSCGRYIIVEDQDSGWSK